jgi:small conductance mechanosensitive channel
MEITFDQVMDSLNGMANAFVARLPHIFLAILVFIILYFVAKGVRSMVRKVVHRRKTVHSAGLVFGRLAQAGIVLLGLMLALVIALPTFRPAQVVEFLGIGTVAIGFAFRDVLQNFLAGILLLITEPFRIGDQIKFDQFEGIVEDIMLRTYDGRRIVIPNANLFTNSVIVNTAFEKRRLEFDVGIGYGDDIARAKEVILDALRSIEEVIEEPPPEVLVVGLAASSVTLRVRWWFTPPKRSEAVHSTDKALQAIKGALVSNGIDLPFDVRTVLFHDQTDETDGDRSRQREGWPSGKADVPRPLNIARGLRELAGALQRDRERNDGGSPVGERKQGDPK